MSPDSKTNASSGSFRLVDTDWDKEIRDAIKNDSSSLRIICPFIKQKVVERLLKNRRPQTFQVITRFNLNDFCGGVSDLMALRLMLKKGAKIRGVRNLHAKLYLFGNKRAIVTSANLTDSALLKNHEFGLIAEDPMILNSCKRYFDELWKRAGNDLKINRLAKWEKKIEEHLARGGKGSMTPGLGDEGANAGFPIAPILPQGWVAEANQTFVKFFGESHKRADVSVPIFDEVDRSGCHWACTYPKGKRPRKPKEGAVIYMARLVKYPNDILIYGQAIGMRHIPGRDDASDEDIRLRPWKNKFPHYIRVHDAKFISGSLSNGVSLYELMDALKSNSFTSTQRNAAAGFGNTDPRIAYRQQAAVELTKEATKWLNDRFEAACDKYGKIAPAEMAKLDWPKIPKTW